VPAPPAPEPRASRLGLASVAIAAVALAWIAALAVLVVQSANPVIVNRVQVWHADVIVLGVWQPGDPPQLSVERTWKTPLEAKSVGVRAARGVTTSGRAIVPLTRISRDLYEVTQGELLNLPERRRTGDKTEEPEPSHVRPLVYPATDDVIAQLEALLSPASAR
jgi:hypothetical protein